MSNGNAGVQAQLGTNYYGNVWLALAAIAYTDDASTDIKNVSVDLPKAVTGLPQLPGPVAGAATVAGEWMVDWGPVIATEAETGNANLMYVASYRSGGVPLFVCVGIRGTDTHEIYTPLALCSQLGEDLDVGTLYDWRQSVIANPPVIVTYPSTRSPMPNAAIAHGTWLGLNCLRGMRAQVSAGALPSGSAVTTCGVEQYVTAVLAAYPGTPIVVTGHSLGGCQTTVMALLLQQTNPGVTVISHPFAPPAAGNAAFVVAYKAAFGSGTQGQIWWNTADIVPNVFEQLPANPTTSTMANLPLMWTAAYGGDIAMDVPEAQAFKHYSDLASNAYQNPINHMPGCVQTLIGAYAVPAKGGDTWLNQLITQHFPPMYGKLMGNISPAIAPFAYQFG
jgi:pimeloyl-ACP methyl ester carboxylesterase